MHNRGVRSFNGHGKKQNTFIEKILVKTLSVK
jgi:hypothetical protein